MSTFFPILLGFLLGFKHAFEADHIVTLSTIVSTEKSVKKSILLGMAWGVGHSATLLIIGALVLFLKIQISATISLFFEFLVGMMLVLFGLRAVFKQRETYHNHKHFHGNNNLQHTHIHSMNESNLHAHHKSFFIGIIHGVAGSGALMIVVLSTIKNPFAGIYYLLIFAVGSIVSMIFVSLLLSQSFKFASSKFPTLEQYLNVVAGITSLLLGLAICIKIIL